MSREYFKNVKAELNEVINFKELELVIPEGFTKTLNSMEIRQLLDDQLLESGLRVDSLVIDNCSRLVEASKKAKHIESDPQRSKRVREYLEAFNKEATNE